VLVFGDFNHIFSWGSRHLRGVRGVRGAQSISQKARNSKAGALISLGKLHFLAVNSSEQLHFLAGTQRNPQNFGEKP